MAGDSVKMDRVAADASRWWYFTRPDDGQADKARILEADRLLGLGQAGSMVQALRMAELAFTPVETTRMSPHWNLDIEENAGTGLGSCVATFNFFHCLGCQLFRG